MSISVLTNTAAIAAQRNLNMSQTKLQDSLSKLSSGKRINSAADDSAGLAISQRMEAQSASLQQASRNSQDGISMTQTADSAMGQVAGLLINMRELSVQAANGTNGASDVASIQASFAADRSEIDRISAVTNFNGTNLLDGTLNVNLQVGTGTTANDTIAVKQATAISSTGMGLGALDLTAVGGAAAAMTAIDSAVNTVSDARGALGAIQNRLNVTINNLSTAYQSTAAAHSRIADVDFATETTNMTQSQVLQQAGVTVLSQANQLPSTAVTLLKGG